MDPLVNDLLQSIEESSSPSQLTIPDIVACLLLSTGLTLVIAKAYVFTHCGYSYSKSFVQAIVLVGITVSLIMVIIGSDIARAFALVGAMSIVRFRTPIKDSRDLVFMFSAIAVGMACGVQFYAYAAIFTVFMALLVMAFHFLKFGELSQGSYVLKMQVPAGKLDAVTQICKNRCKSVSIIDLNRFGQANDVEDVVYEVELKFRGLNRIKNRI
ncbi:MAG: DUF4956 domain-containing protein [Gammaproteobacteria bacterium]|nr:DUF4956 domain-containing protein [Gammaproteobacteria bacterium]